MAIPVVVNSLSGELLKLELERVSTVSKLKSSIFEAWHVPPEFQKLLIGTSIMQDAEMIGSYDRKADEPIIVSMAVSLASVEASLKSSLHAEKLGAPEALSWLTIALPCEVITAVGKCLEPRVSKRMQTAVVRVLSRAIEGDDETALQIALFFLEHPELDLRLCAAQALWPLVTRKESHDVAVAAWNTLFPSVAADEKSVFKRVSVVAALVEVAQQNNENAHDILMQWYGLSRGLVTVALQCISIKQEQPSAISQRKREILTRLQDFLERGADSFCIDADVFFAMAMMPYHFDQHEITLLAEHLDEIQTRNMLAKVLVRAVMDGGDAGEAAKKTIDMAVTHPCKALRFEILQALSHDGHDMVVHKLAVSSGISALHDNDQDVRVEAIRTLPGCIKRGSEDARVAVNTCLHHREKPVRVAAKKALSLIV